MTFSEVNANFAATVTSLFACRPGTCNAAAEVAVHHVRCKADLDLVGGHKKEHEGSANDSQWKDIHPEAEDFQRG